jgi:hypothetical protein
MAAHVAPHRDDFAAFLGRALPPTPLQRVQRLAKKIVNRDTRLSALGRA